MHLGDSLRLSLCSRVNQGGGGQGIVGGIVITCACEFGNGYFWRRDHISVGEMRGNSGASHIPEDADQVVGPAETPGPTGGRRLVTKCTVQVRRQLTAADGI